jgi:hypothetical protein
MLPWAFSGFALDGLDSRSIQTSSDRPGPSLHITAAATSLTSFINVSGQPKSRKREQKFFPAKSYMPLRYRSFGRFFGVFGFGQVLMARPSQFGFFDNFGISADSSQAHFPQGGFPALFSSSMVHE